MTAVSLHTAFDRILDDAAIFPPGNTPLDEAVRRHRAERDNALVATFVSSLARLTELDALLDEPLDVSVVIPAGAFELPATRHARIVSVERHADAVGATPDVPTYVELAALPVGPGDLADVRLVKFRTGGLVASAYPTEAALAAAISAAVAARVPFKCTAGLHNAIRHTGADGYEHHGFLNVLVATAAARRTDDLVPVLAERDGATLTAALRALTDDDIGAARSSFRSFGTCSIDEPVDDLRALGLLG